MEVMQSKLHDRGYNRSINNLLSVYLKVDLIDDKTANSDRIAIS